MAENIINKIPTPESTIDGTEQLYAVKNGTTDARFATQKIVDKALNDVDKDDVVLGNVDNTSDADKPISTAQGAKNTAQDNIISLNTAKRHDPVTVSDSLEIDLLLAGQNITASLIVGSIDVLKLNAAVQASLALADTAVQPGDLADVAFSGDYNDLSNKPDLSVFDNFDEYADLASFPGTGQSGVIYLAEDTGYLYRWNGSGYTQMSAELALGETSSTAYRGDRGKVAYDHTFLTDNPHNVTKSQVGLANVPDVNATLRSNHSGTQPASTISDFQAVVSDNADVEANTSARHDAVTVLDSLEIDFTLAGQQITASLIAGSIDILKLDAGVQASLGLADSAVQSGDLATVATTGDYNDLSNKPDLSVYDSFDQYADLASFPATGNADVVYVAEDTGYLYRWTGSTYAQMSAELAIGETANTAYRGDRGKIAYDHSFLTDNPHNVTKTQVGLGNVPDVDARPRSTHSGTQLASTISDFNTQVATNINTLAKLNAIVADATLIDTTDSRLSDARTPLAHNHATGDITSGTFANARIAESNVTQHEGALSITESQISDLGVYLEDLVDDLNPVLGGDLDADNNELNNVSRIDIKGTGATYTSLPSASIRWSGTYDYDYANLLIPPAVAFEGTHVVNQNGFFLGMGFLFNAQAIIKNPSGEDKSFASFYTLGAQNEYQADNATVTHPLNIDIILQTAFRGINGGTYNLALGVSQVSRIEARAGANITNYLGQYVQGTFGAGSVTSQAALVVQDLSHATNNTELYLGATSFSAPNIPTGNYSVYQRSTKVNRWGGGQRFSYRAISSATTLTVSDTLVKLTGTGTYTVTLPTASGNEGLTIFLVKVDAVGTVTVDGNGSETINGSPNITMGAGSSYESRAIYSDGTNWIRII